MDTALWRSKQTKFELIARAVGLVLFVAISACVRGGSAAGYAFAMICSYLLFVAIFIGLAHAYEKDEDGKVRMLTSVRRNSWTHLFGGMLMSIIMITTVSAWETRDWVPGFASNGQWPIIGFGAGLAFGYFWRRIDNGRYLDLGLPSMLKSPTKWWVDHVQMPMGFALIVTWCVPPLAGGAPYSVGLSALLSALGLLVIADAFRKLNPRDQHILWDPKRFRPARL